MHGDSDGKNAPPAEVRVVVELVGVSMPGPGSSLVIKDVDTVEPRLELEDGTVLYGEYEETLGSQLVFSEENEGQMNDRATADCEERDVKGKKKEIALKCHTDKKLVFRKKRD